MFPERVEPGPGQESVWDYPRPPRLEPCSRRIVLVLAGQVIVDTTRSHRVLETSHPPVFYLPPEEFAQGTLVPASGTSFCEWKGKARYFDLVVPGRREARAAWAYERPTERFAAIAGHVAVYPARLEEITLDGEVVRPQPGEFYGGWITSDVVGPFKGEPGTLHW